MLVAYTRVRGHSTLAAEEVMLQSGYVPLPTTAEAVVKRDTILIETSL